jgi:hypothetical protein
LELGSLASTNARYLQRCQGVAEQNRHKADVLVSMVLYMFAPRCAPCRLDRMSAVVDDASLPTTDDSTELCTSI